MQTSSVEQPNAANSLPIEVVSEQSPQSTFYEIILDFFARNELGEVVEILGGNCLARMEASKYAGLTNKVASTTFEVNALLSHLFVAFADEMAREKEVRND